MFNKIYEDIYGNKVDYYGNSTDSKGNKYHNGKWISGPNNPNTNKNPEVIGGDPKSLFIGLGITVVGIGLFMWLSSVNFLKGGVIGISIIGALIIFYHFAKELGSLFDTRTKHQKNLDYLNKLRENDTKK